MEKLYQVTEYDHPWRVIDSQWGHMQYVHWLYMEGRRWFDKDCSVTYVKRHSKTKMVALWAPERSQIT